MPWPALEQANGSGYLPGGKISRYQALGADGSVSQSDGTRLIPAINDPKRVKVAKANVLALKAASRGR